MKKNPVLLTAGILVLSMAASSAVFADEVAPQESSDIASYVLMNIPYGEFYANEYEGGDAIDSVSSATMNKPGVSGLTGGSYHLEDNSKILGVSYPVAVPEGITLDESMKVADADALYAAADYSYCELAEVPSYYKVLSEVDGAYVFSKSEGEVTEISSESASITDSSVWCDYVVELDQSLSDYTVYGSILHTAEGDSYGMRTLENIWRGYEIGFTTTEGFQDPHSSSLLYEPYVSLMGQTIDQITYFTNDGIKSINVELYVPVKFENTLEAAAADVTAKETTVTMTGYPEDYDAAYTVSGSSELVCDSEKITWDNAYAGTYTLYVSDQSGKYASYSTDFILSTTDVIAIADNENAALVKAEGVSDEAFAAYIAAITDFDANGTTYSSSGHRGTQIVLEDGSIDKTQNSVFSEVGDYELVIRAAGYADVTMYITITEVAESDSEGGSQGGHEGGAH